MVSDIIVRWAESLVQKVQRSSALAEQKAKSRINLIQQEKGRPEKDHTIDSLNYVKPTYPIIINRD